MTISQLKYILSVAEYKNFTSAAEHCFVTQPTLSMQIQKVEEELQVQIFDRTKKPIQLTEIGEKIVQQAKNIVSEANRIQDIVDQQKGFIGGEFRLGIIPTVMPTLLPMFLNNFIKKYPRVELIIEELNSSEIIERLKKGQLDAALAATPLEEEEIKEIVLYFEPFMVYAPKNELNNPKKVFEIADLDSQPLLLLQDGHCFRNSVLNLCKTQSQNTKIPFKLESGSFETLVKLANEDLGITLLPYLHSLDLKEIDKNQLFHFNNPKPAREISLIYSKRELKMHIINALRNTITGVVKGAITFQDIEIISPIISK